MFNRIWKKFTLALLVVASVPIVFFGYQDLGKAKSKVSDETLKDLFLNCVARSKDIERVFMNATADINQLRASLAIDFMFRVPLRDKSGVEYWRKIVQEEFRRFLALKPGYSKIGLLDDYGNEIVVVERNGKDVVVLDDSKKRNRLTSPSYVTAARLDKFAVASITMRSALDPALDLRRASLIRKATKVFDRKGKARGVIYLDLNGSEILSALVKGNSFERRRPVALVTHKGSYIFNPFVKADDAIPPKRIHGSINGQFPGVVANQILSGRSGIISDDPNTLFAYTAVYPRPEDRSQFYTLVDRYPRESLALKFHDIKKMYLTGALGALALAIVVALLISRALTRSLAKLREGVEKFGAREFSHRIDIRSGDEIESLAKAYNLMAESLQDYSRSLENKVEERTKRVEQVERRLALSEKLAAIGFLSAGVAHEINNPMAIIFTRLELLQKAIDSGDMKNALKDLETLKNHAGRVSRITGDLLTFSRTGSNELAPIDLNEIVRRVVGLIKYPIREKGVQLDLDLSPLTPRIWASADGMEQVIYNITYNAYQATDAGGKISISTCPEGDGNACITIRDSGSGIGEEVIDRIFEPFYTTKKVGEGTGLGLSISYGLVKGFGGVIDVESGQRRGTAFTIRLSSVENGSTDKIREVVGHNA